MKPACWTNVKYTACFMNYLALSSYQVSLFLQCKPIQLFWREIKLSVNLHWNLFRPWIILSFIASCSKNAKLPYFQPLLFSYTKMLLSVLLRYKLWKQNTLTLGNLFRHLKWSFHRIWFSSPTHHTYVTVITNRNLFFHSQVLLTLIRLYTTYLKKKLTCSNWTKLGIPRLHFVCLSSQTIRLLSLAEGAPWSKGRID